jgi:hypothetical protein
VWASDFAFHTVGKDTPTTNMYKADELTKEPVNLDFTQPRKGTTTINVLERKE